MGDDFASEEDNRDLIAYQTAKRIHIQKPEAEVQSLLKVSMRFSSKTAVESNQPSHTAKRSTTGSAGSVDSASTSVFQFKSIQNQYLTKHPRLCLFLRPEFCVEAVVLTVSTRELRTDRRRAVAVGGGQPPTRQRRHSPAGLLGRWLAVESVVRWPIRGDGLTHREGRPRSSSNHIDELLVRPPPEATPASAGVATYS